MDGEKTAPAPTRERGRVRSLLHDVAWGKIGLFGATLFLFILAITLMKDGARDLTPLVRDLFSVTNAINSMGFGWLFSYLIMSGSPVAAVALTFFDSGIIDQLGAFTMVTGSRLGASFIVLFIGFIYVLRGRSRANSLGMGLLSLLVTGTTHLAALVVGVALLDSGVLDQIQIRSGFFFTSFIDVVFTPISRFLLAFLPRWSLFLIGLGLITASFQLFDKCIPEMTLKESQIGELARIVYRPWIMFVLGGLVTLISMSVSVSLGILVPLGQRGFVRRENVIPYIMGANVTTFVDTLLAAVLLDNAAAFTVVVVEMVSIAIVSLFILAFFLRTYRQAMLRTVEWTTKENGNLALFMGVILVVPLILLLL
ncbi:MAG: hypothetical protein R3248_14720 [Candidatus Promineifilaceae bacterium]|nr:hypothetical protein [Candidatus Promineifilaceae bacterium]